MPRRTLLTSWLSLLLLLLTPYTLAADPSYNYFVNTADDLQGGCASRKSVLDAAYTDLVNMLSKADDALQVLSAPMPRDRAQRNQYLYYYQLFSALFTGKSAVQHDQAMFAQALATVKGM